MLISALDWFIIVFPCSSLIHYCFLLLFFLIETGHSEAAKRMPTKDSLQLSLFFTAFKPLLNLSVLSQS